MAQPGPKFNKQRKRRQDSESAFDVTASKKQQSTLSQVFGSSDHERRSKHIELSPTSKRRKLSQDTTPQSTALLTARPASIETMYNFGSSSSTKVVDLTKSPNGKSRRVSGGARTDHFAPQSGPRKLVVKNLRTTTRTEPSQYCEQTIGNLETALTAIFSSQRPALSNEELYRGAENLCKLGKASELSVMLLERIKEHVLHDIRESLAATTNSDNRATLSAVLQAWVTWNGQLVSPDQNDQSGGNEVTKAQVVIRQIFTYLDRSFLLQSSSPSIYETAIGCFRTYIFADAALRPKIIDGACDLVQADRMGDQSSQVMFKESVEMFHELSIYSKDFEPRMLHLSQDYIVAWSEKECADKDLPDYVRAATQLIETEMERCNAFDLDATTRRALLTLLEHHIVERREAELSMLKNMQSRCSADT